MPLYTFESQTSFLRLRDKTVVVDTSYLINLIDINAPNNSLIFSFHEKVKQLNSRFIINAIVRQEFLKEIRKVQMIDTLLHLASTDPTLRTRYARFAGNRPLTARQLSNCYDKIYKDYLRAGDVNNLISSWQGSIESHALTQQQATRMNYYDDLENIVWSSLSRLMQNTGLAPTDAMIANFAFSSGADAIVTTDLDFIQVSSVIDVFMPAYLANQATSIYNPAID